MARLTERAALEFLQSKGYVFMRMPGKEQSTTMFIRKGKRGNADRVVPCQGSGAQPCGEGRAEEEQEDMSKRIENGTLYVGGHCMGPAERDSGRR